MRVKLIFFILFLFLLVSCSDNGSKDITKIDVQKINISPLLTVSPIVTNSKKFIHSQFVTTEFNISESLGSGLAVIDIDNDNSYEVFISQFDKNHSSSILYKIDNGKFVDITKKIGLDGFNSIMGAAVADINNDGWDDILIYGYKELHMMINNNGFFNEIEMPDLPINSFYTGATFFKSNQDSYLDLWLNRYVDMDTGKQVICNGADGLRQYCAPSALPFQADLLLINQSGTSYEPAEKGIIDIQPSPGLGVVAADFNNDGLQDIFVANDGEDNYFFEQELDGRFIEKAQIKGVATNSIGVKEASMGIAVGDFDNNGLIDLFATHLENETNTLYKNEGLWFDDATNKYGLSANGRNLTGFGTGFYDLNADNWLDLFVVNGRIQPIEFQERINLSEQYKESPLLYLNKKTVFEYIHTEEIPQMVGRGVAFVDIDNDGDIDVFINNNNQSPVFLLNNSNPENWIGINVKCQNRMDYGAKIEFTVDNQKFYRHIHSDGSYGSSSDPRVIMYGKKINLLKIEFTNGNVISNIKLKKQSYNTLLCH